ncbi:MAG TPA: hypothetical protein VK120_01265 [Sporosarcina sp.]|nr:hypothetical protein [Sporosarcina sp.]
MKKYRLLMLLTMLSIVLAACTEQQKSKQQFLDANEGKNQLSIEDIEKDELFRWDLTEEVEAIVVKEEGEMTPHEELSLFGEAGEETFRGNVSLYLIHNEIEKGYLQQTIEGVQLNTTQSFKAKETFQQRPVIAWTEIVSEDLYLRSMWQYIDGELQMMQFGEATQIAVSAQDVQWIEDTYMQMNVVERYGVGQYEKQWIFQTWEWQENRFILKNERMFKDTNLNRLGEQVTKRWIDEGKVLPFEMVEPETYTITKTSLPTFEEGAFLDHQPKIGDDLLEKIFDMPPHIEQEVVKDGVTIMFSDGFTYTYEPDTFTAKSLSINGKQLTSSLAALRKVFGEEAANSYDVEEAVYTEKYVVGDYRVMMTYRKDEARYMFQLGQK